MDKSLDEVIASGDYKFNDFKRHKRVDKQQKTGVKTNKNNRNNKPYVRKLNVNDLREFITGRVGKDCTASQDANSKGMGFNVHTDSKSASCDKEYQKIMPTSQPVQLAMLPTFFVQSPRTSNGIAVVPSLSGCVIGNSNAGVATAVINQQRQLLQQQQQLMYQQLLRQQVNQKLLAQQQLMQQLRQQEIEQQQLASQQQLNLINGMSDNNNPADDASVTISLREEDFKQICNVADLLKLIETSGN